MGAIWSGIMIASCIWAVIAGTGEEAAQRLITSGQGAVELALTLAGTMMLWSGLMGILEETGDATRLGRGLRRVLAPLFGGLTDEESWDAIGLNIAANIAGLGNAATPAGIRAAELLSQQGEVGLRALAMLLVLNNSGLQLIPTTVIGLRAAAGSQAPADILLPSILSSGAATVTAVVLMGLIGKGERLRAHHHHGGTGGAARHDARR